MDAPTSVERIMTRAVVSTRPDARLEDAARLLREYHISGLPVVGPGGEVVGVLTERDLVRDLHAASGVGNPRGLLDLVLGSTGRRGESLLTISRNRLRRARVEELMTRPAVTIPRGTPIAEAARLVQARGMNRLPVVDDAGRLIGIVTRADLVAAASGRRRRSRGALRPAGARPPRRGSDPYSDA